MAVRQQLKRRSNDPNDGKASCMENPTPPNDVDDVDISVESSGVVHDSAGPDDTTVGSSECSHGGHDRCICGMAG